MIEWFVVGGAVRDLLLGNSVRDLDVSFAGGGEAFLQVFPHYRNTGGSPEVLLAQGLECTELQGSLEEDMLRRDLTVNAAAIDARGCLFCHPRFLEDLCAGVLRLSSPEVLEQDPLRVFRAARFAAMFPDFDLDGESLEALRSFCNERRDRLAVLPRERVCQELMKAMAAARPSRFFTVLQSIGGLQPWFSEFVQAPNIPAGPRPWHDDSLFEHTLTVMDRCAGNPLTVWMALCHDLGKTVTEPALLPHHYGHEHRGVELVRVLGERIGVPKRYLRAGMTGTELHMKGGIYGTLRVGTRRDLLVSLGKAGLWHEFWKLACADGGTDWEPAARRDWIVMSRVRLPKKWQDKGELSGQHLRLLQCHALGSFPRVSAEKLKDASDQKANRSKES